MDCPKCKGTGLGEQASHTIIHGKTITELENLYRPLGIESERWYKSPCGVYYSVAEGNEEADECASSLTALEMLKIGRLFLQGGVWEGQQIISKEYIRQAVSPLKSNSGYGMLWWRGDDWYGGRGYGGQSITIAREEGIQLKSFSRITFLLTVKGS